MKIDKTVKKETLIVLAGTAVCSAVMQAIFLIVGKYDYTVLTGSLLGGGVAVLNFFLLGLTVQKIANSHDENNNKKKMYTSYIGRLAMLAVVLALGAYLPYFHWLPLFLSVIFPRLIIFIRSIVLNKQNNASSAEENSAVEQSANEPAAETEGDE